MTDRDPWVYSEKADEELADARRAYVTPMSLIAIKLMKALIYEIRALRASIEQK